MRMPPLIGRAVASWCLLTGLAGLASAADPYPYRAARFERGELAYRSGLPVLSIQGTPEDLGRQAAALTADAVRELIGYPQQLLQQLGQGQHFARLGQVGQGLVPQIPPDHLRELAAFAKAAELDRNLLIGVNTLVDCYRGGFGCSSLIVDAGRSATGGPLMGRNLDFFSLGRLHRYSLVTVVRPQGKRAFVSVGFPGLLGCFSGMNDAGLAVAVHEVFLTADGAPMFNPDGMPYALCFRRILEECATVAEAERLLRSCPRTTLLNLAVCDRRGGGVLEMTPRSVVLRAGENGICACVNHFRTKELAIFGFPRRYNLLMRSQQIPTLSLGDVGRKLHEVNQGKLTLQTMIFEPAALRLHLSIGAAPSSARPLGDLDLAPLFGVAAAVH